MKNKENKKPKLNKSDKIGVVTVVALAAVVIALLSVGMGANDEPSSPWVSSSEISTAPNVTTTAVNVTASQTTTTATTAAPVTTTVPSTADITIATPEPTTEEPTTKGEPTKEEILKIVSDGVNSLKASDASYVGTKNQDITITVTDCSFPAFTGLINSVISLVAGQESYEYDFTNGKGIDPEENVEMNTTDAIAPVGIPFSLTIDGVASASYEKQGDNTVYSVTLVPEVGTYDNPKPTHHGVACDTLDFSLFEIPTGGITKADFNYPGAIITVTLDGSGKVIGYSEHVDMDGVGEGSAMGIGATASMEGYIHESWEIVWK